MGLFATIVNLTSFPHSGKVFDFDYKMHPTAPNAIAVNSLLNSKLIVIIH